MALSHISSSPVLRRLFAVGLAVIIAIGAVAAITGTAFADSGWDNDEESGRDGCSGCYSDPPEESGTSQSGSSIGRAAQYTALGTSVALGIVIGTMAVGVGVTPLAGVAIGAATGLAVGVHNIETGGDDGFSFTSRRGAFGSTSNCRWIYTWRGAEEACD